MCQVCGRITVTLGLGLLSCLAYAADGSTPARKRGTPAKVPAQLGRPPAFLNSPEAQPVVSQLPPGCVQAWQQPVSGSVANAPVQTTLQAPAFAGPSFQGPAFQGSTASASQDRLAPQRGFPLTSIPPTRVAAFAAQQPPTAQPLPKPIHAPPPRSPNSTPPVVETVPPGEPQSGQDVPTPLPPVNNEPIQDAPSLQAPVQQGPGDDLLGDANVPSPSDNQSPDNSLLGGGSDALSGMGPSDGGDPLSGMGPVKAIKSTKPKFPPGYNEPLEKYLEELYPSANSCQKCHPQHYDQWRGSAHGYSAISPMFHRFEQKLQGLAQGTLGYFCFRCHAPVATQMEFPREQSILDAPHVYREGITCVACHRVIEYSGKTNGERRIETGNIHQAVVAAEPGLGLAEALANREQLKLKLSPNEPGPGQAIHTCIYQFELMAKSDYCVSCHQVAVHPGIALEVVWNQYRAGPAAAKGQTCQDCHMGQVPGKPNGYACATIAEVANKPYGQPKQFSNHTFWGPGCSVAHPGVFPHNPKADRWSPRQWLLFDWRNQWGTEEFERQIAAQPNVLQFPAPWNEADERRDARKVLNENLLRLVEKKQRSVETMENAVAIVGPEIANVPRVGASLKLQYVVHNTSEGHNLPTGSLGAQPQLWLNVVLIDSQGCRVWESGDLDPAGDLRDMHSEYVRNYQIEPDQQLFNLQTKFLITNLKGTDREAYLPVNLDVDQIPFLRPATIPISVLNHPPLIRMEAHSIPPLGNKVARYEIPGDRLRIPGVYRVSVRLRSRMEPPYFMRFCDATPEMIRQLNESILDIGTQSYTFEVLP